MDAVVTLPVAIDEESVRRLCGPAAFAQADAFQRAGHVLGPRIGGDGLDASVRGTWHRVAQVTVQARAGKLQPLCVRDGAVYCRHVGAVLLQWLRTPSSFAVVLPPGETGALPAGRPRPSAAAGEPESPAAELARLFDRDTVNHLRDIARGRGVRLAANKKADVVRELAAALAEPAGMDTAIAALSRDERLALDAVYLGSAEAPAQESAIADAFRVLGGAGEPPLTGLVDSGLILNGQLYYGPPAYLVPRSVTARLPALDFPHLAPRAGVEAARSVANIPLGIFELLQVIALELAGGTDQGMPDSTADGSLSLIGFTVDPTQPAATTPVGHYAQPELRLTPRRSLPDATLERLAARTGQPLPAVDFGVRLLLALEIAQATPHVAVRGDRLQALLDLAPALRLGRLVQAWLAIAGSFELGLLAGAGGRLRLRWQPIYAVWADPFPSAIAAAARLVARLAGRLGADQWYDLGSFVETVERLTPAAAPGLARLRSLPAAGQALSLGWVTDRGKEERLVLRTAEGWARFLPALVGALLDGPLRWLGLVEVVARPDRSGALRRRPAAAVLTGRDLPAGMPEASGSVIVDDDLTVLVPAGTTDVAIHGYLARAGELIEASAAGLRYRLTAAGSQAVFAAGTTGPEFARFLAERAGGALPPAVATALDRWWSGYGTIRLYDELALIEFGDDVLLAEVLAATSLASALIHTISPRLVAIDPSRVEGVVAELTARGYAPRVVEEG